MAMIRNFVKNLNFKYLGTAFVVLSLLIIILPTQVEANFVTWAFANLYGVFRSITKNLLALTVAPLFQQVMAFDNFFTEGVNEAWIVVRDFANLLFGLVLLFIAIATVLSSFGILSKYSYKSVLGPFIVSALLINFSKAIVGIVIDISQIIMLEFYNAIVAGGGVFNNIAGITAAQQVGSQASSWEALQGNVASIAVMIVLSFVMLWTILTLVIRIATLWILILTGPLAFLAIAIPPMSKVYSEWTKQLGEQLVVGPLLMFYIYLALRVFQGTNNTTFNILNYVLVLILLSLANIYAKQGAQSAPGFAKNLVGGATGFIGGAALGIGSLGVTGQSRKTYAKLMDTSAAAVGQKTNFRGRLEAGADVRADNIKKGTGSWFGAGYVNRLARATSEDKGIIDTQKSEVIKQDATKKLLSGKDLTKQQASEGVRAIGENVTKFEDASIKTLSESIADANEDIWKKIAMVQVAAKNEQIPELITQLTQGNRGAEYKALFEKYGTDQERFSALLGDGTLGLGLGTDPGTRDQFRSQAFNRISRAGGVGTKGLSRIKSSDPSKSPAGQFVAAAGSLQLPQRLDTFSNDSVIFQYENLGTEANPNFSLEEGSVRVNDEALTAFLETTTITEMQQKDFANKFSPRQKRGLQERLLERDESENYAFTVDEDKRRAMIDTIGRKPDRVTLGRG